jgi:hypothetical protein
MLVSPLNRSLTIGIQIRLTKPFQTAFPGGNHFAGKQIPGLPKSHANHKSGTGTLQCPESVADLSEVSDWERVVNAAGSSFQALVSRNRIRTSEARVPQPVREENGVNAIRVGSK